jgi:hypothetical protein
MPHSQLGNMTESTHTGLKKQQQSMSTVVFMTFCLCAASASGAKGRMPGVNLVPAPPFPKPVAFQPQKSSLIA